MTIFLFAVAVDPSGSFAAITGESAIFLFRLSNGVISPSGSSPVQLPMEPGLIASVATENTSLRPTAYPILDAANQVNVFRFDVAHGTLTPTPGSPFVLKDTLWRMVQARGP